MIKILLRTEKCSNTATDNIIKNVDKDQKEGILNFISEYHYVSKLNSSAKDELKSVINDKYNEKFTIEKYDGEKVWQIV